MKTLKSTIIDLIKEEECIDVDTSPYMNHIVVKLPEEKNSDTFFNEIQNRIINCINRRLPHRTEDVLIDITSDEKEKTFIIPKQTP